MELDGDRKGGFPDVLQDVTNTRGRDKVAVEQRKLRNDALSDVYCSRNIFIILCCCTLTMGALRCLEMYATVYQSTWRNVLGDRNLGYSDEMKEDEMSRTCSTNGSDKECIKKGRDHLGDLGVDGRIILK